MSGPEELRALVEEMRATLEPLRRYYDLNDCDDRDDDDALEIPIADLRRARTTLPRAESSLASPARMEGWTRAVRDVFEIELKINRAEPMEAMERALAAASVEFASPEGPANG